MTNHRTPSTHERWANFRFAVVGPLLAAPPARSKLHAELERIAATEWTHPINGEPTHFAFSTIERWFLAARKERLDPVGALRRKVRKDAGQQSSMADAVRQALRAQYATHPSWSAQLHHQNLVALAEENTELGTVPSYSTVRRFLKANGLVRRRRVTSKKTAGAERAQARLDKLEVRSYEAEYVGGLLHWDFHECSRSVLVPSGEWVVPQLFGALDDRSRVACHLQWYLTENAENCAHGLSQAFQKRGLFRVGMSDNGTAMTAAELTEGLERLGVIHETTLPYSPYQNAKQESFWTQVEGRLLAMLEDVEALTLALLNEATQAWVEQEYNRSIHSEIGQTPNERWLLSPDVLRPSPDSETLRLAFTRSNAPDVPVEALHVTPRIDSFCWRVEQLIGEGGFALVTGVPGTGKSVVLRILADRLLGQRDVQVGVLSRPQAGLADFYREMGDLFGVDLRPHNRWAGAKLLRDRWQTHIDASLSRPVLIIDEAQETKPAVLSELRLLSSARLDSHTLLTVILGGDRRLVDRLRTEELLPLDSRLRARLVMEHVTPEELLECLRYSMAKAGAAKLMTAEVCTALCEHAAGNHRALMNMAGELLAAAARIEARNIDEKLFFDTFAPPPRAEAKAGRRRK